MCENKFLKQAKEELAYLSGDESFQYLVESRAGFLMDQVSEIIEITGLSKEEIEKI